ncbi:MAG: GGDEF domain-containing protein, partial [Gammaproteobacteria bacterium]|nr:GGDEF domain-containing protein [Gammaproteobacteria bacterium]
MHIFIPAIWITAGVSLFSGVLFTFAGIGRKREPGFLPFGLLCLLLSIYLVLTAEIYLQDSAAICGEIEFYRITLLCLIYPLVVWFFGEFMRLQRLKPWIVTAVLIFGIILILNFASDGSFFYYDYSLSHPVVLNWGESLINFNPKTGPLLGLFYAASYAVFLWALWRSVIAWRAGAKQKAIPIAVFLIIQVTSVVRDQIVAGSPIPTVSLGQFVFLALVLLMSFILLKEMQQRTAELERSLNALQTETERRRHVENRLHHMAYHDYLTDLPNRRLLREILNGALKHHHATGQLGAIVFLDLDHFKTINDSL